MQRPSRLRTMLAETRPSPTCPQGGGTSSPRLSKGKRRRGRGYRKLKARFSGRENDDTDNDFVEILGCRLYRDRVEYQARRRRPQYCRLWLDASYLSHVPLLLDAWHRRHPEHEVPPDLPCWLRSHGRRKEASRYPSSSRRQYVFFPLSAQKERRDQ